MKKTILIVACVSLLFAVSISRSLAAPGTATLKEKEAVDKVLKGEGFTPTLVIAGPNNTASLVAVRCFDTNTIYQVAVYVHAQTINVQVEHYRRGAQGWQVHPLPTSYATGLQRKIENEVAKEK